jgi:glycerol-3-phosphate O-acyltransferase
MEQREMVIVLQWYGKHDSVAVDTHATITELLDVVLPMKSVLRLDDENQLRV